MMNIENEIMNANPKAAKALLYIEGELNNDAAQDLIKQVAALEETWSGDPVAEEYAGLMGAENKSFVDYVREDVSEQLIGLAHQMWLQTTGRDKMVALLSALAGVQVLGQAKYDSGIWAPQGIMDMMAAWNREHGQETPIYAETIGYDLP